MRYECSRYNQSQSKNGLKEVARNTTHKKKIETQDLINPVINLPSYILMDAQISLLSRGLGFSPTNQFDVFGTILDVNSFARTLTLRNNFFQ